jgi:predicted transcriptional regulator
LEQKDSRSASWNQINNKPLTNKLHKYSEFKKWRDIMSIDIADTDFLALTAQIVSAHVGHNSVTTDALPALITSVHAALKGTGNASTETAAPLEPAVPIKRSVFPDYIVCLEDGKKLKMLKRHLQTAYGMTPDQYRAKWGLPASYPLVAPNYAEHRSTLAKSIGLGRKPGARLAEPAVEAVEPDAKANKVVKKMGRPRKAG